MADKTMLVMPGKKMTVTRLVKRAGSDAQQRFVARQRHDASSVERLVELYQSARYSGDNGANRVGDGLVCLLATRSRARWTITVIEACTISSVRAFLAFVIPGLIIRLCGASKTPVAQTNECLAHFLTRHREAGE